MTKDVQRTVFFFRRRRATPSLSLGRATCGQITQHGGHMHLWAVRDSNVLGKRAFKSRILASWGEEERKSSLLSLQRHNYCCFMGHCNGLRSFLASFPAFSGRKSHFFHTGRRAYENIYLQILLKCAIFVGLF